MAAVEERTTLSPAARLRAAAAAARAAPRTGSVVRLYAGTCSQEQPSSHAGSTSAAASSGPTPRSVSMDRCEPPSESETTTPVFPSMTGPTRSTPRPARSPATRIAAASVACAAISLLLPPSATTQAATLAACPPVVTLVLAGVSVSGATGPAIVTTTSRWASPSTQITPVGAAACAGCARTWRQRNVKPARTREAADEAQARPARHLQPRQGHRPGAAGHHRRGGQDQGARRGDHPGQGLRAAQESRAPVPRAQGHQGAVPPGGERLQELRPGVRPLPLEIVHAVRLPARMSRTQAL